MSKQKHVLRWVENTPDGRKRKTRTFYGTYREAVLELERLHVMHADDKPCPTIGRAAQLWYFPWLAGALEAGKLKPNTAEMYERVYRTTCAPRWEACPLDSVKPAAVQEWLHTLPRATAAASLTVLRKIGDLAVKNEAVAANKFRIEYDLPVKQAAHKTKDVLTLAEADAMARKMAGSPIEGAFILACFGSARLGESLGVYCDEVAFTEANGVFVALVPIRRRVDIGSKRELKEDLKTRQSNRTLVIPGPYARRLQELCAARAAEGYALLTANADGGVMSCATAQHIWSKQGGRLPFSNLRTSWRTFAQYEWGVDYDTCEILMGHKLPGVTGAHYLRPTVEQLADSLTAAYAGHLG